MRKLLFSALAFGLWVALMNAAAPPRVFVAADQDDEDDGIQDVLYVGKPHPVLIRLNLRVEKKSAFTHYHACMKGYFDFLDRNDNKTLDKVEASKVPSAQMMLQLIQGNNAVFFGRGNQPNVAVKFEDLDEDRDGKVTFEEFEAYYLKNGVGPIVMTASSAYGAPQDPLTDVIFNLLDTNKDGKLSKKEIEACEQTLLRYDTDDNELVSLEEVGLASRNVTRRRVAEEQALARQRKGDQPPQPTNLILVPRDSGKQKAGKNAVARELIAKYDKDKDGSLERDEIGFPKELFDAIDRNKDGKLSMLELSRWLSGKPAGDFTVKLYDQGNQTPRRDMMNTSSRREEMSVSLGGVRINVAPQSFVTGFRGIDTFVVQTFKTLDEEKKGFITRRQVEGNTREAQLIRGLFDAADRNNDGKLTEAELKGLLNAMNNMRRAQITLSIFSTGSGMFQTLDVNGDGQLSLREMRNAWKVLQKLDLNKDGYITRDEFPTQFQLSINQGNGNLGFVGVQPDMRGQPGPRQRPRGPVWFVKMDRNGDGDVSPAEWLGSKEDFDAIDTDKDGLISLEEAEAYDAKAHRAAED